MDKGRYELEIQELIDKTTEIRFTKPTTVIQLARELLKEAERIQDHALRGYAYFCIGDAYYTLCESDNCLIFINQAIKSLFLAKDWQKLGECYNLLGILFSHQGNTSSALDSYYAGMEIAEEHELDYVAAMLYENYAELCARTDNVEEALRNALISREYADNIKGNPRWKNIVSAVECELVRHYIRLGQKANAGIHLVALEKHLEKYPELEDFDPNLVHLFWAQCDGDKELEQRWLDITMQSFLDCEYRIDYFWNCIEFMKYLDAKGDIERLEIVVKQMEKSLDGNGFPDMQVRLCKFKCDLLEKQGKKEELLQELMHYREQVDLQNEQQNKIMSLFVDLRNSLISSKKMNLMLQERLGVDELTGIANRRRMNEVADRFFETSYQSQESLAVEMIDIDKFKEINDTYGHSIGDACLVAVAEVLRNHATDDVFCARYGGDEFFILYRGKTDDEILMISSRLQADLTAIAKKQNLPEIYISQGICNRVPKDDNRVWDFTSAADQALYYIKKQGGNNVVIVHSKQEISAMEAVSEF